MTVSRLPSPSPNPRRKCVSKECGRLTWAWEQAKLQWNMRSSAGLDFLHDPSGAGASAWVEGVLRVGWWSLVVAISVTVFVFGAVIGGLK